MPDQRLHAYSKFFLAIFYIFIISTDCHAEGAARKYEQIPGSLYDFYNSLGVCAHVTVYDTKYGNKENILRYLQYLDITLIRDDVRGPFEKMLKTYQYFNAHGIKFNLIMHQERIPSPKEYKDELLQLAPYLVAIEGPNEVDNIGRHFLFSPEGQKLYGQAINYQKELYDLVKNTPELEHLPVLNFTIVMYGHAQKVRNLVARKLKEFGNSISDYSNVHVYDQRTEGAKKGVIKYLEHFSLVHDQPIIMTETGYPTFQFNEINKDKGGKRGISKEVSAKYLLNVVVGARQKGVAKLYIYELLDDVHDPKEANMEDHFGLFDYEGNPKSAARALRNMRLILKGTDSEIEKETKDSHFVWHVTQDNSDEDYDFETHHLLLREGKDRNLLIVWAEPKLWDSKNHKPFEKEPEGNNIQISFEHTPHTIRIYDPLAGTGAIQQYKNTNTIKFLVKDHPIILEITSS